MVVHVKYQGVTVEGKPPPRKRCFISNFPIAATPTLLASTAESKRVDVVEVIARTAPKSEVKISGWILWAILWAILWSKRENKNNVTDVADVAARGVFKEKLRGT